MEGASIVQPYEGEPRVSNEDFDEERQRRFLTNGVQVKIRTKKLPLLNVLFVAFLFLFYVKNR